MPGIEEALTIMQPTEPLPLAVQRAPEAVLDEAHKAAAALKKVIESKKKKLTFNGKTYLEFEDWLTVGRFYGVTARIREVKHVQFGDAQGFEAFAEAILVGSGQIVSAADAMCLNDEPNWSKKPLFQLRSMAQTRACAKAMRNVLAWVVVLAGYAPTPAEEMDGLAHEKRQAAQAQAGESLEGQLTKSIEKAKEGDFVNINISEVHMANKNQTPLQLKEKRPGDEYMWVADGRSSWPCFDAKLFDKLRGLVGEDCRIQLKVGKIVGVLDKLPIPPANDQHITDKDLPF